MRTANRWWNSDDSGFILLVLGYLAYRLARRWLRGKMLSGRVNHRADRSHRRRDDQGPSVRGLFSPAGRGRPEVRRRRSVVLQPGVPGQVPRRPLRAGELNRSLWNRWTLHRRPEWLRAPTKTADPADRVGSERDTPPTRPERSGRVEPPAEHRQSSQRPDPDSDGHHSVDHRSFLLPGEPVHELSGRPDFQRRGVRPTTWTGFWRAARER